MRAFPAQMVAPVLAATADTSEFDEFVRQHRDEMFRRARRLCRGAVDADDVLQDALERAWKAYGGVRDRGAGRAWLFAILNNTFIDRLRRQQARPPMEPIDDDVPPSPHLAPATERWAGLDLDDLRAAVAELPDDLRDVYRLHALEGRDYIWLAEHFGMPKASIGSRLLRARKRLREILEARLAQQGGGGR